MAAIPGKTKKIRRTRLNYYETGNDKGLKISNKQLLMAQEIFDSEVQKIGEE